MIKHGKWSIAIKKRCYSTFTVESVYFKGFESFDPFKMSTKVCKKSKKFVYIRFHCDELKPHETIIFISHCVCKRTVLYAIIVVQIKKVGVGSTDRSY